jgi:nitroimidazol reductase NimA-like FMN-containing flavoprotein (pyridoxamine 5'-phosphate oxidase superfamily)
VNTTDETRWADGRLVELTDDECWQLLSGRSVGRVAWTSAAGQTVLPVNFVVVESEIWFRTSARSSLSREVDDLAVAFEIDDVDDFTRSGWSVLVRGTAQVVHDAARLPRTWPGLETWPGGGHPLHVAIRPDELTGRRLLPS